MFHWRPAWARYLVMCVVGLLIMLVLPTRERDASRSRSARACTERWSWGRAVHIASLVGIGVVASR